MVWRGSIGRCGAWHAAGSSLASVFVAALAVGCSGTSGQAAPTTASVSSRAVAGSAPAQPGAVSGATVTPTFESEPATTWAGKIPGCAGVSNIPLDELGSAAPALAAHAAAFASAGSAARCTVEHQILLLAFRDENAQAAAVARLRSVVAYLADGPGWVAIAARPDSPTQAQSVVAGIAQSLGGQLLAGTGGSSS